MEEFEERDDFSDLYADVEVQVSSAISAIQALSQLPLEDNGVYCNGDTNGDFQDVKESVGGNSEEGVEKQEEEVAEGREDGNDSENESESEDDFDIVLNDNDNGSGDANENVRGGRNEFLSGGSGRRAGNDDEEYGNDEKNEGKFGVENGGSSGGERSSGGKGGFSGGSYNSQYKYMRHNSTTFSSKLNSCGSPGVASYLSSFVRGDWKNSGCTYQFGKSLIGSQSGPNFSLPHSRTILDLNIDELEQKPWRNFGADITDFFNFGFDEDSWKSYCNRLDMYRKQTTKVAGGPAYLHANRNKMHLSNHSESASNFTQNLKGRNIQVEDGHGERLPSVDTRLPVDRDSDVVIEIPVKDLEEDHSNLDKVPFDETTSYMHEASRRGEADADDAGDMLYFSVSEDELPMLEGPAERTRKSNPHRCFGHTSTGDGGPSSLDSNSFGSLHVSDANELQHQVTKCDSDRLAEEIKAFDEPEKSDGTGKPKPARTSEKTPESSRNQQIQRNQSSSPSLSDYIGSRGGSYAAPDKFHDHSKMESPNSAAELRESITFDYHSSNGSRKSDVSMRSGDCKYDARCRSSVQRNMKFQHRRSSRILGLKNHLDDECASHMSDAEDLHDTNYPAVSYHKQRKRHNDLDSYRDKDYLNHEESEHSLNYRRARFPSKVGCAFNGYPHGKDNQDRGYKRDRYPGRNVKDKIHFSEQRTPRLSTEAVEREWYHYRKGIYVQEMDSSNYDVLSELINEEAPHLDNVNHARSNRKVDEFHFKRRMESNGFSAQCNHSNEFTQEKYRSMPYNGREKAYLESSHDRELPDTRREAKNPLKNSRRYGNPFHDCKGIWHTACEDERSRYTRNQLSFRSYREPLTAGRDQGRAASFSSNGMLRRPGWQRRGNCVERYRGSNKLDDYTDVYINDDESILGTDDIFVGRRQYQQSEVLLWSEQENYRRLEDNIEARGTSCPFGRTSNYKRFYSKPDSVRGKKLIDGTEPDKRKYKLPIDGDMCSQFDRSSNSVHRENLRQAHPSCWNSADSRIVGGNRKSSRSFKAGSLLYCSRYDFLDWKDGLGQGTVNGFDGSRFEKDIQADSSKIDGLQNDANWSKKLPDSLQNDSLDIEEGQIVTEDLNKKPRQKAGASEDARKFVSVKNFSSGSAAVHQNINDKELENSRIAEILAKMEKRKERFQQPITLKNVPEKNSKPVTDSNAEAKAQRPARKRKWDGS